MSVVSAPIPDAEASVSEQAAAIVPVEKSANEMSGFRTCAPQVDAIQKCISPISENV